MKLAKIFISKNKPKEASEYKFTFKNIHTILAGIFYLTVIICCVFQTVISSSVETAAPPTEKKAVLIDVGHGGWDPGKVVPDGTEEKGINLSIAQNLQSYLSQSGCIPFLTRSDDSALASSKRADLKERIKLANDTNSSLMVSIHQNYFPSASVKGAQVFYYTDDENSKALADFIQQRLKELDSSNTRIAKPNSDYYLLKQSKIPTVIVECGFLSNKDEKEKLLSPTYQSAVAWAIYNGILDYLGSQA